jgi:hypothetical protein
VINKLVATKLIHWKIDSSIVDVSEEGAWRAGFSRVAFSSQSKAWKSDTYFKQ